MNGMRAPKVGTVVNWRDWQVIVTGLSADRQIVRYRATAPGFSRVGAQTVAEWQNWARGDSEKHPRRSSGEQKPVSEPKTLLGDDKNGKSLKSRPRPLSGDSCVTTTNIGGPCPSCAQPLNPAHIAEVQGRVTLTCSACCPAPKHDAEKK